MFIVREVRSLLMMNSSCILNSLVLIQLSIPWRSLGRGVSRRVSIDNHASLNHLSLFRPHMGVLWGYSQLSVLWGRRFCELYQVNSLKITTSICSSCAYNCFTHFFKLGTTIGGGQGLFLALFLAIIPGGDWGTIWCWWLNMAGCILNCTVWPY